MSSQERFADFFGERVAVVRICKYDEICGYFLVYQGTNSSTTWLQNMLIFSYPFFSWFFSRRSWAGEIGATIDSDLHLLEARKTHPSGLKEKMGSIWIFWLKLWIWILFLLDLFTRQANSPPSLLAVHPPVFVGTWKNSGKYSKIRYTHLLILRGNILHVCWSLFRDLPLFWALEGGRADWLVTPPSSDIEVSPFPRANVWAPGVNHLGDGGERLHLRTSSVFPFACHVTFGHMCFKKKSSFQPPLSPLLQNMFRKNLYNWKLYKIHLKKAPKNPRSLVCNNPNLPCLGRKCIHSMATK